MWTCIYVDDMLMLGDGELIEEFMAAIQDQYKIHDLLPRLINIRDSSWVAPEAPSLGLSLCI